jgi:hypothetical protein
MGYSSDLYSDGLNCWHLLHVCVLTIPDRSYHARRRRAVFPKKTENKKKEENHKAKNYRRSHKIKLRAATPP